AAGPGCARAGSRRGRGCARVRAGRSAARGAARLGRVTPWVAIDAARLGGRACTASRGRSSAVAPRWRSRPSLLEVAPGDETAEGDKVIAAAYGSSGSARPSRKVRAPQGRVLAFDQSGRPEGKCHRKQTARVRVGKGERVR